MKDAKEGNRLICQIEAYQIGDQTLCPEVSEWSLLKTIQSPNLSFIEFLCIYDHNVNVTSRSGAFTQNVLSCLKLARHPIAIIRLPFLPWRLAISIRPQSTQIPHPERPLLLHLTFRERRH